MTLVSVQAAVSQHHLTLNSVQVSTVLLGTVLGAEGVELQTKCLVLGAETVVVVAVEVEVHGELVITLPGLYMLQVTIGYTD